MECLFDFQSVGNIYKGLSQTGAWGCFDEFNRISVEVLSVVAVQVKTIQDAIKMKKKRFNFLGEDIVLRPSVGLFITMNPGYAGRTGKGIFRIFCLFLKWNTITLHRISNLPLFRTPGELESTFPSMRHGCAREFKFSCQISMMLVLVDIYRTLFFHFRAGFRVDRRNQLGFERFHQCQAPGPKVRDIIQSMPGTAVQTSSLRL